MSVQPGMMSVAEYIAMIYVAGELAAALFTLFRAACFRARYERRVGRIAFTPSCALIIPVKGLSENAERVFQAYLSQDYPAYQVLFVVESEDDPAVPFIRSLVEKHDIAHLVIAGLRETCCQKNHNIIAGAREAGDVEALAFSDDDILPDSQWLRRIVAPLSDPEVTISTAFRWLVNRTGSRGGDVHVFMNMLLYTLLSVISSIHQRVFWGGSFAIRRRDFESLGIASRWKETVAEDVGIHEILSRNNKKTFLAPGLLVMTDEVISSPLRAVTWFSRQLLFTKACMYPAWLFGIMPAILVGMVLYCLLPFSIILSMTTDLSFRECGGGAALLYLTGEMALGLLFSWYGPVTNRPRLLLRVPLLRLMQVASGLRTIGRKSLVWGGIEYRFDRKGTVTEIIDETGMRQSGSAPVTEKV